jgi:hypothetical protein
LSGSIHDPRMERKRPPARGDGDSSAADEFDESSTAVTERRQLPQDVQRRLKVEQDVRELLDKRAAGDE